MANKVAALAHTGPVLFVPDIPELSFNEEKHQYRVGGKFVWSVSHYLTPIRNQVYGGINKDVMDAAARRGTAIHFAIELYNDFGAIEIADEHKPYFEAYLSWADQYRPETPFGERRVYHPTYWYAGTSDLLCTIGGAVWLVDYKAVAQLHPMLVGPQLAAYAKAWQFHGVPVEHVASLHLKKDGKYSFDEYSVNENFSTFLTCLELQNYIDTNMRRY